MPEIGLLNEKPLHSMLREWYAQPEDRFEVAVDGFVIDIVRGDLLIEIQTGNLASIKSKMITLARSHSIRLIYPIALERRIVKLAKDEGGGFTCRKSPKRGRAEDLFWEMVSFPELLANPNFSLELLMIREEEVRRYEGTRKCRRREWAVEERRLLEVIEQRLYEEPGDWGEFLPRELRTFTGTDLADATGITNQLAQKIVYCLRKVQLIRLIGKQGRANLYTASGS